MFKPTQWKSGLADEAWKVMICARDATEAENLISGLAYILDNPGNVSLEEQANVIRKFTGGQIADALLVYHLSNFESVRLALKGETNE